MGQIYAVDGDHFEDVADALREKTGDDEGLTFPDGFIEAIGKLGVMVGSTSKTGSGTKDLVFEGIPRAPIAYAVYTIGLMCNNSTSTPAEQRTNVVFATWEGKSHHGAYLSGYRYGSGTTNNGQGVVYSTYTSHKWEGGTLTITSDEDHVFRRGNKYYLIYVC